MRATRVLPAFLLCYSAGAEFGLGGQLFQLQGSSSVNNAKLAWAPISGASSYNISRSAGGSYSTLDQVAGTTYDDYDLTVDTEYTYNIIALDGSTELDESSPVSLTPYIPSGTYASYDNTAGAYPGALRKRAVEKTRRQDTIDYRYEYVSFDNGSFSHFEEQTSTNGDAWTGDRVVLDNTVLCASANYSCHLERITWAQNPDSGMYIMWAHFERTSDYSLGEVCNIYTEGGAESLTFNGAYRPLDHDSRDLAFFIDDSDAYLVSSTNTNADMNIYSLESNWTAISSLLTTVNIGQHREAPAVIKSGGWYYLFSSLAAGWLPSQPQYIAAESMAGPWSTAVDVANIATFASQSGGVIGLTSGQYYMASDRWSANWPTPGGDSRQLYLPLSVASSEAFASYHFYPSVEYSSSVTTAGQGIYGVQSGKILSDYKYQTSNSGSTNLTVINNAIQNNPTDVWIPNATPFWVEVDLGDSYTVSQIDLTTKIVGGSETFYQYNVTGSNDGTTFSLLADKSDNTDPGFSTSFPTTADAYRWIRINVDDIINSVNGNSATWAAGIIEVTIYGQ